jgi:hypothetical protein
MNALHDDFEERLRDFYELHNPSLLREVPGLLGRYKGREKILIVKLEEKYDADFIPLKSFRPVYASAMTPYLKTNEPTVDFEAQLRDFYEGNNPAMMHEIPGLLDRYRGREGLLIEKLEKKYKTSFITSKKPVQHSDVSLALPPVEFEVQLRDFYIRHNPGMMDEIPGMLERYRGRERLLKEKLEDKYRTKFVAYKPKPPPLEQTNERYASIKPQKPTQRPSGAQESLLPKQQSTSVEMQQVKPKRGVKASKSQSTEEEEDNLLRRAANEYPDDEIALV